MIAQYANVPLQESIGPVARELALRPLFVAVKAATSDDLELTVAADKQGHLWIYVFTDQEELSRVFTQGSAFAEMSLSDILATIGPNEQFGGIFINSKSEATYLIPRDFFAYAYKLINTPPQQ